MGMQKEVIEEPEASIEETSPPDDEAEIPQRFTWSVRQDQSHQLFVLSLSYGWEEFMKRHPAKPSERERNSLQLEIDGSCGENGESNEQENKAKAKEDLDNEAIARLPSEAGSAMLESGEVFGK